jgi:cytochrome c553
VTLRRTIHVCALAVAVGTAAVAGVGLAVTAKPIYNRPSAIYPAGNVGRGKALAETCLACHGQDGPMSGDPGYHPPKLRQQHPASIFYALEDYKNGSRKNDVMAPFATTLSEQDMRDVAAYLSGPSVKRGPPGSRPGAQATTGGGPGRGPSPTIPDSPGLIVVRQNCGFCHGRSGEGVMDGVPVLTGQYSDYLSQALSDYRSGARSNATMKAAIRHLTPQQEKAAINYLAAQPRLEVAQ